TPPVRAAADPYLSADRPVPPDGTATVRAVWLPTSPSPASGQARAFSSSCPAPCPTTLPATGASRPPALVTCCVSFAVGETDEGLDAAAPVVVEGKLVVIRHPARGQFRAVVEFQVREARRVRRPGQLPVIFLICCDCTYRPIDSVSIHP